MSKHTKGPWKIADGSNGFVYALNEYGSNRFWLNVSSAGKGRAGDDEVAANARLIAAAPLLLDVLDDIVNAWFSTDDDVKDKAYSAALAAIKQAKGE